MFHQLLSKRYGKTPALVLQTIKAEVEARVTEFIKALDEETISQELTIPPRGPLGKVLVQCNRDEVGMWHITVSTENFVAAISSHYRGLEETPKALLLQKIQAEKSTLFDIDYEKHPDDYWLRRIILSCQGESLSSLLKALNDSAARMGLPVALETTEFERMTSRYEQLAAEHPKTRKI